MATAPSQDVWNDDIRVAWAAAYSSAKAEESYEISEIEGTIPPGLRGTVFRNGPGNFERGAPVSVALPQLFSVAPAHCSSVPLHHPTASGGKRFAHVLDGDGLICRFTFDGDLAKAHFSSRFVRTPAFEAEVRREPPRRVAWTSRTRHQLPPPAAPATTAAKYRTRSCIVHEVVARAQNQEDTLGTGYYQTLGGPPSVSLRSGGAAQ